MKPTPRKRPARRSDPSPARRAARAVLDLLAAEDTPEVLRSLLDDFANELVNEVGRGGECACSLETTARHLPALLERAEARGLRCQSVGLWFAGKGERGDE